MLANQYESFLTEGSNSYIAIGRSTPWETGDDIIPDAFESTQGINDVYRNLVFLKRITNADIMHVTPINSLTNWTIGTVYDEYNDKIDLYDYNYIEQLSGNVSVTDLSYNVTGYGTAFTSDFVEGDKIYIYGTDDSAAGQYSSTSRILKEIVSIANDTFLTVNSYYSATLTQNNYALYGNFYPQYNGLTLTYVKTAARHVFKCLSNNNGARSSFEPEIDVGGSLPQNPYIETADGYKWKYMYTISVGEMEKFSEETDIQWWMPVKSNNIVTSSTVDGRIDIIKIFNGGTGYLSGGNSSSANIISVIGNGTGANVTANVQSGVVMGVNIIDGGSGYTNAIIKVTGTGSNANLVAVIGPRGGHGSNPIEELGATHLMISVELDEDGGGKFPVENTEESFDFRQISIISDPKDSDGNFANNLRYNATYVLRTSTPDGGGRFHLDDYVYQGPSFSEATFSGTIAYWDETNNEIWINNTNGTLSLPNTLYSNSATNPSISVTAFQVTEPEIQLYSGDVLYVRNYSPVVRTTAGSEQIRILVSF